MGRHSYDYDPIASPTALLPQVTFERFPLSPNTLGHELVPHVKYAAAAVANADYFLQTGTAYQALEAHLQAEQAQEKTRTMLDGVRARVAGAPDDERVEGYLYTTFGRVFESARMQGAPHSTVRDWLADKEQGATNAQLYDFVTSHLEYISGRQQDPEVVAAIERTKARYVDGVERAVSMGLYVPEALDSLRRVQAARVLVGDFWDEYIMEGKIGYAVNDQDYIVIGQQVESQDMGLSPESADTIVHELDHIQFDTDIIEMHMPAHFREAMAEHAVLSITRGQWHVLNPYLRHNDSGIYSLERSLQDSINNDGRFQIKPYLAIRAHSAPQGHPAWDEYMTAVHKAWGVNLHEWAQARIDQYAAKQTADGLSTYRARMIAFERVRSEMHRGEHQPPRTRVPTFSWL